MKTEPMYKRGKYNKTNKRTLKLYVSLTIEESQRIKELAAEQHTSQSAILRNAYFRYYDEMNVR